MAITPGSGKSVSAVTVDITPEAIEALSASDPQAVGHALADLPGALLMATVAHLTNAGLDLASVSGVTVTVDETVTGSVVGTSGT